MNLRELTDANRDELLALRVVPRQERFVGSIRALVLREPELGVAGVRAYLQRTFGEEDAIECHFGEPVAGGDGAAVEWWSSWTEGGHDLTMAGVTILRFDADGMVVDHRDYWNQLDRRVLPFDG